VSVEGRKLPWMIAGLGVGVIAFVGVCLACSLSRSGGNRLEYNDYSATRWAEATRPKSTSKPAATNTPVPSPTGSSPSAYADKVGEIGRDYAVVLSGISHLADSAETNTSLIYDEEWKADLLDYISELKAIDHRVYALECPDTMWSIHSHLVLAATHYDIFAEHMEDWVEAADTDALSKAAVEMALANDEINKATEAADAITAQVN